MGASIKTKESFIYDLPLLSTFGHIVQSIRKIGDSFFHFHLSSMFSLLMTFFAPASRAFSTAASAAL